MNFPKDLKYTDQHEWIRQEGEIVYVGITYFAQDKLSDIVYLDVSTEGESLAQGDPFGSVEAVKTVSDLYMPISGNIIEFNEELEDNPQFVNTDPYGKGWIIKIKYEHTEQIKALMSNDDYKEFIQGLD